MTNAAIPSTPSTDRIELMETFVRIVDAGSLSAAAAQMGTTQPTVSRRLQVLERSLGVRLLRRSTHSMTLTEDGQRCLDRARELLASWHAFGQERLVAPLATYLRRHPRVNVEWLLHDRRPDFIADGIDCAVHVGEVDDPGVVAVKLADVARIVVAAPGLLPEPSAATAAGLQPADLARLPWLAMRPYYRSEVALTRIADGAVERLAIRPRVSTDSLYALRNGVLQGVGAGIASAWVVADDVAQGRLRHVATAWRAAPLPVYLVYPYARFYPARLLRFLDVMREMTPAAVGA